MKRFILALVIGINGLGAASPQTASVSGQWQAEFDTQVGPQSYRFNLTVDDARIIGTATAEMAGRKRDVTFDDVAFSDNTLTFVELMTFQDNQIRIAYTMKENNVPHIWHVDDNGHDATHWRNSLYYFVQKLFRP